MADRSQLFDQNAVIDAVKLISDIIEAERQLFPDKSSSRIFLGGFSQGCFMSNSIYVSYPGPDPLGGIICTSGLIALSEVNFNKTAEAQSA